MGWTATYLNKRRTDWINRISRAQYYAGGVWYTGDITLKEVQGNGIVIRFAATDSKSLTITQIRLIDTGGDIAYQESRTIVKGEDQGALIQITAPIVEA
jgi:hypothetical protein